MTWTTNRRFLLAALAMIGSLEVADPSVVSAHEGPPFPILIDQRVHEYMVSVWADPDIGESQFFIIVETPDGNLPQEVPSVSMWVEPVGGRLDRVVCETTRQRLRNRLQFSAEPYFDQQDMWTIGIQLTDRRGATRELTTQVESTPPGYGLWDFAIYLFPFFLLAGFWAAAMIQRIRVRTR